MEQNHAMSLAIREIIEVAGCYREVELGFVFDDKHVLRWVEQFEVNVRLSLLKELAYVLERTYVSRQKMKQFLQDIFKALKAEDDICEEWLNVHLLQIQDRGHSQREVLALFDEVLRENCEGEVRVSNCNSSSAKNYLDSTNNCITC